MRLVNNIKFSDATDVTFQLTPVALWTFAEVSSGIICGCLPVLPAFFRHFASKITFTFNLYSPEIRTSKDNYSTDRDIGSWNSQGKCIELNNRKLPLNKDTRFPSKNAIVFTANTLGADLSDPYLECGVKETCRTGG